MTSTGAGFVKPPRAAPAACCEVAEGPIRGPPVLWARRGYRQNPLFQI